MIQQRLVDRLTQYWDHLRKDAPIPEFSSFSKSAIQDIWDSCIIMTAQPTAEGGLPQFQFKELGSKVRALFPNDPIGQYFTAGAKVFPAARIMRRLPDVYRVPPPIIEESQFVTDKSKIVKFRSCLVPFGRDGKVSHVLVGLSWREF